MTTTTKTIREIQYIGPDGQPLEYVPTSTSAASDLHSPLQTDIPFTSEAPSVSQHLMHVAPHIEQLQVLEIA